MNISSLAITLQILWAKPGNPREGGRVDGRDEGAEGRMGGWEGGGAMEGEA